MNSEPLRLIDLEYRPLPRDQDFIRLIKLAPRSTSSRTPGVKEIVQCDLVTTPRSSCPPYTAISYSWGNNDANSLLAIGGQLYRVGDTIEQVLRQLQPPDDEETAFFWLDQLCINQQDDAEKSDQVQKMRHIYSDAERVVAWLGPAADGSDMLLKHLQGIAEALNTDDHAAIYAAHSNASKPQEIARSFRAFCKRQYWTRLWVIQEYAVGKDLSQRLLLLTRWASSDC
ncbi:heterokaryon incompatibility protein-domain-containing protein [Podospora aff. communis PSN243]|uniref:Heterokaryon incompatibility protein-domain-containing protein n=1 Tax=Podospora aff. communis PSN243 TaxID=3040156 RepID=A0AAV9H4J9_9PEZI|nr:heterokaryon incompatibility protein-domain-containing protein [Podospora aff. communis PSN243]